jgi:hypothetical protein
MWRFALVTTLVIAAAPVLAHQPEMEVAGQAGILGEWEITGRAVARPALGGREYAGPIQLKHSGICTTDGPEQKSGEIRFRVSGASRIRATLTIDGVECSYQATKSDAFKGSMSCPDRRDVPLLLWLK